LACCFCYRVGVLKVADVDLHDAQEAVLVADGDVFGADGAVEVPLETLEDLVGWAHARFLLVGGIHGRS